MGLFDDVMKRLDEDIMRTILGADSAQGADETAVAVTVPFRAQLITPAQINRTLLIHGETFSWMGRPWHGMTPEEQGALCAEHGDVIHREVMRNAVERSRRREEEMKARAAEAEQERKEFLDYCQAQHPDVLEEFRRVRLVKSKLARFAGVAKES